MTAREYFAILDSVIQGARERKVLRVTAGADDLLPVDRLEFLTSATATIYIQSQRHESVNRGAYVTGGQIPGASPGALTQAQRRGAPSSPEAPSPSGAPATPPSKVPPESQGRAWKEGDTHGDYTYHKCPKCGQMKWYKKWWPKALCWECWKEANPR